MQCSAVQAFSIRSALSCFLLSLTAYLYQYCCHSLSKASTEGQAVFDRLLKACNEVKWSGESIIVLNNIKVEAPYHSDNCKLLKSSVKNEESLTRVKRIVDSKI